jgi:hypothetical protein
MIRRFALSCLAAAAVALAGGCSPGVGAYEVEGSVTLDGAPLTEGDIVFQPEDPKIGPEGGKIKDGRYKMKAKAGANKVEIRAVRAVPGKTTPSAAGPGAPPDPVLESIVPEKYNNTTELKADVGAGKTKHDFTLKSK